MDWVGFWAATLDWIGKALLVLVGAGVALLTTLVTERRAARRESRERDERRRQRQYELGRDAAMESLNLAHQAWTLLASRQLGSPTAPLEPPLPASIRRKAELIPNATLRRSGDALFRLLADPVAFERNKEFAAFIFPKGPAGAPPTVVKQTLAVETYQNMLAAFLREEDPDGYSNPIMDVVVRVGTGMGLTVTALYDQA